MVGIGACSPGTTLLISALLLVSVSPASSQAAKPTSRPAPALGKSLFARDCAFCHGRDAAGGESGPDLTRSRLVARDVRGDKIRAVVHDGRIEKGMPAYFEQVKKSIPFGRYGAPEGRSCGFADPGRAPCPAGHPSRSRAVAT